MTGNHVFSSPPVIFLAGTIARMTKRIKSPFWERLRTAMIEKGIKPTQKNAGALVGISQTGARRWQLGTLPSMPHARIISEKLGVNVEWLLTGRGAQYPVQPDPDDLEVRELLGLYRAMTEAERYALVDHARWTVSRSSSNGPPVVSNRELRRTRRSGPH